MGHIFCALVLFFVVFFSVDAWSMQRKSDDTLCSHDHPLYPYIKLFDGISEEWRTEQDDSPEKKPICFTRITTTESDDFGEELKRSSSYEITFGLPKKYESVLGSQSFIQNDGQEYVNYPPFEESRKLDGITTKDVVNIRCSRTKQDFQTPPTFEDRRKAETTKSPEITTVNHDLDFMNDLDEICDEHLDIDILDSLPSEDTTPQPDTDNTRRYGGDGELIEFTTNPTTTTSPVNEETTEFITTTPAAAKEPSILSRMDGTSSFTEITTELTQLITEILEDMKNITETPSAFTVSMAPFEMKGMDLKRRKPKVTTHIPVTEEIRRSHDDLDAFIIQMKNIAFPNSEPRCYLIDARIKYGKCSEPMLPIRILTESKLPKKVEYELLENLEKNRNYDEMIVSGKKNCYLLKKLTGVSECPTNHDHKTTILEIDDLPDNPNDDPYFTISFHGKCTVVSKSVDVIECPIYQDTLPNLATENLPDHVRFKHFPGEIDVHQDDIVVHSYSHCLLLRAMQDVECGNKPDLILDEEEFPERYRDDIRTTDPIVDEESLPTYRHGDYSFEGLADDILPKSDEETEEYEAVKHHTTPCIDDDTTDPISRTTRTLPHPTTPIPVRRLKNDCSDNDLKCLMDKIQKQGNELKSRRTLKPSTTPEYSTTVAPTTQTTPILQEIKIPNSRKLSKLLETILNESTDDLMPHSADLFKPDFVVKIACAQQISKASCFYVSKYIMRPSFDDPHEYHTIIDTALLPLDAKIISAPNLNIFEANETIRATSDKEKYVLIKKHEIDCPNDPKDYFFILDTGSCAAERREEPPEEKPTDPSIVKYKKGNKIYCFDFDENLKLHLIKCPEVLMNIPVLSRPEDLKTLCRSQLKYKGQNEQMKLLRRLNIVTD